MPRVSTANSPPSCAWPTRRIDGRDRGRSRRRPTGKSGKADIPSCIAHVRFFKADMTFCSGRRRTGVASPAPLHILDLPAAAKVTLIAPSVAPNRTGVRIHGRCRKYARRRIDRILINYHWRRRYNDRSANHDGFRLLDNDRRRSPVLVAWNFAIGRYRQIGGCRWRGKSQYTCCTQDRFAHVRWSFCLAARW